MSYSLFSGACTVDHAPIERVAREADHLLLTNRELMDHSCHTIAFDWSMICSVRYRKQIIGYRHYEK
ncbi:hypothetical protein Y032_0243g3480 [Ancylostoma ceylanicum]|uniref:Uncharacterized protein n=1 Tax=Ancylostoma ceylanicum TaxID=53326 RepID=A0A016SDE2_9BILA|nr:hypothetical protein Y032_0243g3480 [Ancylostoma ceylanicum]